jgi:hypothetical protein
MHHVHGTGAPALSGIVKTIRVPPSDGADASIAPPWAFDEAPRDREAEARAAGVRRAHEAVEDPRLHDASSASFVSRLEPGWRRDVNRS